MILVFFVEISFEFILVLYVLGVCGVAVDFERHVLGLSREEVSL
jgi:hypothetical protein